MSNTTRAFSLIEVMTAVAILGVGLLALVASMSFGVQGNRHAEEATQAANLNRQIVEIIRSRNWAFDDEYRDAYFADQTEAIYAVPFEDDFERVPYTRQIRVEILGGGGSRNNVAKIRSTVHWIEKGVRRQVTFETMDRN